MAEVAQLTSGLVINHELSHKISWTYPDVHIAPSDVEIVLDMSEIWAEDPTGVLSHFQSAL